MAQHRAVRICKETVLQPHSHMHIVSVGTGQDTARCSKTWTVTEIYEAMDSGDFFFTRGENGETALVQKFDCPLCSAPTLRSSPDAEPDNNLDNLPICD